MQNLEKLISRDSKVLEAGRYNLILIITLFIINQKLCFAQNQFTLLNKDTDWKLAFKDPCTGNWYKKWFLDGKMAKIKNSKAGMNFSAGPENRNDAHHAVLWTKKSFRGDLKIEYNYTRTDNQTINVNILFIQATGIDQDSFAKDITKWNEFRTIPTMSKYFKYMKTLHVSYAAFNTVNDDSTSDYIRARQYPVTEESTFKDIEIPPTYYKTGLFLPGVTYQMTWLKSGEYLYLNVEGDGKVQTYSWHLDKPEKITQGRIGLRHMYTRSATYSDFKVYIRK